MRPLLLVTLGLVLAGPAASLPPGSTPREIELGEQAARDIAKSVQFVDDPETVGKLQGMLDEIALVTDRPDIEYRAHLIYSPMVNAFVIPGGWVYVTTGLVDNARSDHEIAGVLCHEVAHNVNQHAIQRMRNTPKGLGLLQLASIAALIISGSPEAAIVADAAASTITAAVLNGHTIEMEVEADSDGILYMTRTEYNPTGFLTFMEELASTAGKFIEEEMGIYRTHPLTRDRVYSAKGRLEELGVPVLRRLVTDPPQPESRNLIILDNHVTEITYLNERLLLLHGHDDDRTAAVTSTIRYVLDHEIEAPLMKIIPTSHGVDFAPKGGPACSFHPEDGRVNGEGEALLARDLRKRLADIVAGEQASVRANYQLY